MWNNNIWNCTCIIYTKNNNLTCTCVLICLFCLLFVSWLTPYLCHGLSFYFFELFCLSFSFGFDWFELVWAFVSFGFFFRFLGARTRPIGPCRPGYNRPSGKMHLRASGVLTSLVFSCRPYTPERPVYPHTFVESNGSCRHFTSTGNQHLNSCYHIETNEFYRYYEKLFITYR
jgi:hypothetical protein